MIWISNPNKLNEKNPYFQSGRSNFKVHHKKICHAIGNTMLQGLFKNFNEAVKRQSYAITNTYQDQSEILVPKNANRNEIKQFSDLSEARRVLKRHRHCWPKPGWSQTKGPSIMEKWDQILKKYKIQWNQSCSKVLHHPKCKEVYINAAVNLLSISLPRFKGFYPKHQMICSL